MSKGPSVGTGDGIEDGVGLDEGPGVGTGDGIDNVAGLDEGPSVGMDDGGGMKQQPAEPNIQSVTS